MSLFACGQNLASREIRFTIVHPVPTFGDLDALKKALDHMEELGLYFVYDMRHTYNDLAALTAEVNMIKYRPNLLLWYTADEPDGTSEPLNATRLAYDAIYALDGYHPVSIALNCADYEFTAYAAGADIVMPDTYTIANDPTFSSKYNTSCTETFGCCGCDNCHGVFEDISKRLDDFALRLDVLGWTHEKALWAVPQAFGGEESVLLFSSPRFLTDCCQILGAATHGAGIRHSSRPEHQSWRAGHHALDRPNAARYQKHGHRAGEGPDFGQDVHFQSPCTVQPPYVGPYRRGHVDCGRTDAAAPSEHERAAGRACDTSVGCVGFAGGAELRG